MFTLLIETSTERGIVALFDDKDLLFIERLPIGFDNSQYLFQALEKVFQESKIVPKNLSCVAVGVGPGSYTGIRVGAITAKAFSFAQKIPLIGFCSLQAFVPYEEGSFAALLDAKIGGIYLQKGIKQGNTIIFTTPPLLCPLDEIKNYVQDIHFAVSPTISPLKEKMAAQVPLKNLEWVERPPSLCTLQKIVRDKWKKEEYSLTGDLELLYLRKSQAEIDKQKK